jgi:hypothetical protein
MARAHAFFVIAMSEATKQSRAAGAVLVALDCFAALAMTLRVGMRAHRRA